MADKQKIAQFDVALKQIEFEARNVREELDQLSPHAKVSREKLEAKLAELQRSRSKYEAAREVVVQGGVLPVSQATAPVKRGPGRPAGSGKKAVADKPAKATKPAKLAKSSKPGRKASGTAIGQSVPPAPVAAGLPASVMEEIHSLRNLVGGLSARVATVEDQLRDLRSKCAEKRDLTSLQAEMKHANQVLAKVRKAFS